MLTRARLALRRRAVARRNENDVVREYLSVALPHARQSWRETRFVALDIETTGLDPQVDEMLSIGWVPITHGRVQLSGAQTHLVKPAGDVGQSAVVHGLTDTDVSAGAAAALVFTQLLQDLAGAIVIVHHATLDIGVLDRVGQSYFGDAIPLPVIDTLALEHQRLMREDAPIANDALRLGNLRRTYRLPEYSSHNCLTDAIATAELFLAMVATRFPDDRATLKDLWA